MKLIPHLLFGLIGVLGFSQNLEGAWKLTHQNGNPVEDEYIKIYQDGYFAFGAKKVTDNSFISAGGGLYNLNGENYTETLDFFTPKPELVGTTTSFKLEQRAGFFTISTKINGFDFVETWQKVSTEKDSLTGNWVITGRKVNNELREMKPGARRTIKILSGGRFQWVAFNSETKEFMGTGGGTYTAKNGVYTENIHFFSRDNSRVGSQLNFEYKIVNGQWHHSGKSSKGEPIYEIWSPYSDAFKKD